jgi:hypothetical protein
VPIVLKSESLNLLETSGPVQACNGIALPFFTAYLAPQGNFKSIIITVCVQMGENKNVFKNDKGVPVQAT